MSHICIPILIALFYLYSNRCGCHQCRQQFFRWATSGIGEHRLRWRE